LISPRARRGLLLDAEVLHDCRGLGLLASEPLAAGARAAAAGEGLTGRVDCAAAPAAEFVPVRGVDAILRVGPAALSCGSSFRPPRPAG
jgi:hypothetical protein